MGTRTRTAAAGAVALALAAAGLAAPATADEPQPPTDKGSLVMIGGNLQEDAEILQRIVDLADDADDTDEKPTIASAPVCPSRILVVKATSRRTPWR